MKFLKVNEYQEKKKFEKIWLYQNEGSSQNGADKIQTFYPLALDTWNFQGRQKWRKDKIWQNLGVTKWGVTLNRGPKNFELLNR